MKTTNTHLLHSALRVGLAFALALACACNASSGGAPGGNGPGATRDAGAPSGAPGITLRALPPSGNANEILVEAVLSAPAAAARVMELQIRHSPELTYVDSSKGDALKAAAKELVVQDKAPDLLRTLAYSAANVSAIGSGTLVRYRFTAKGAGPFRIEVLTDKPIFAPPQANAGLHVGDPLDVRP